MGKKLLERIGDLRAAFWLILLAAADMAVGAVYAALYYQFFDQMNGWRVHQWFFSVGINHLGRTWWIPLLFLLFLLLGINTAACILNRCLALWPRRRQMGAWRFFQTAIPTLVHAVFLVILAGHLLTFTTQSFRRYPLQEGQTLDVPGLSKIRVESVRVERFPDDSLMAQRIRQARVTLAPVSGNHAPVVLRFLEPVAVGGQTLHLDLQREPRNKQSAKPLPPDPRDANCNKEHLFRLGPNQPPATVPRLWMVVSRDPGLGTLLGGFGVIIVLLALFYARPGNGTAREPDGRSA